MQAVWQLSAKIQICHSTNCNANKVEEDIVWFYSIILILIKYTYYKN